MKKVSLPLISSADFYWALSTCCPPPLLPVFVDLGQFYKERVYGWEHLSFREVIEVDWSHTVNSDRTLIQVEMDLSQKLHGSFHYTMVFSTASSNYCS